MPIAHCGEQTQFSFFSGHSVEVLFYVCSKFFPSTIDVLFVLDAHIHVMRDHPGHHTPILGGLWGAKFDNSVLKFRQLWFSGWDKILKDNLTYADRSRKQPDQMILRRYIWPWAQNITLQHDSYL